MIRRGMKLIMASALTVAAAGCESETGPPNGADREITPVTTRADRPTAETSAATKTPAAAPAQPALIQPTLEGRGIESFGGRYYVVFTTDPDPVPLNEPFSLEVQVLDGGDHDRPVGAIALHVDGRMPQHRHGMAREPVVTHRDDGTYLVEGMLFHMSGEWKLYFDVTEDGRTERAACAVELE